MLYLPLMFVVIFYRDIVARPAKFFVAGAGMAGVACSVDDRADADESDRPVPALDRARRIRHPATDGVDRRAAGIQPVEPIERADLLGQGARDRESGAHTAGSRAGLLARNGRRNHRRQDTGGTALSRHEHRVHGVVRLALGHGDRWSRHGARHVRVGFLHGGAAGTLLPGQGCDSEPRCSRACRRRWPC